MQSNTTVISQADVARQLDHCHQIAELTAAKEAADTQITELTAAKEAADARITELNTAKESAEAQIAELETAGVEKDEALGALSDQLTKTKAAMDWFWQIDEAYVRGRLSLCRSLIQNLESAGLVDYLPRQSATANDRFSPYDRYQEIKSLLD